MIDEKQKKVLSCFQIVRAKLERKINCLIKASYSDNGGEYDTLQQKLENPGIKWECCAPYTPRQNIVAERLNRTVMETARTLLIHTGLLD